MSKKLAAGSDAIVLDVKTGSGAFMMTVDDLQEISREDGFYRHHGRTEMLCSHHQYGYPAGTCDWQLFRGDGSHRDFKRQRPSGISILVMTAQHFRPAMVPIETIFSANFLESSTVFINAPLPVFTSSTIASLPAASFLLMMEEAIQRNAVYGSSHVTERI